MIELLSWLNHPAFELAGRPVPYSDLFGNICALGTVVLALRRSIWAWPVQILGSVLLFAASISAHLGGNASRQVVIIAAAIWGWTQWRKAKAQNDGEVVVRWATWKERIVLLAALVLGTAAFAAVLHAGNWSWNPIPDAYIFVGSVVAMYAQGKAIVEFWFVWLAVDLVGIPLAIAGGLVFSGVVYFIFLIMVLIGLRDWARRSTRRAAFPQGPARDLGA